MEMVAQTLLSEHAAESGVYNKCRLESPRDSYPEGVPTSLNVILKVTASFAPNSSGV